MHVHGPHYSETAKHGVRTWIPCFCISFTQLVKIGNVISILKRGPFFFIIFSAFISSMLSRWPFVFPNPIGPDTVNRCHGHFLICIVAAQIQLFDYHNCSAVTRGAWISTANENWRCKLKWRQIMAVIDTSWVVEFHPSVSNILAIRMVELAETKRE